MIALVLYREFIFLLSVSAVNHQFYHSCYYSQFHKIVKSKLYIYFSLLIMINSNNSLNSILWQIYPVFTQTTKLIVNYNNYCNKPF